MGWVQALSFVRKSSSKSVKVVVGRTPCELSHCRRASRTKILAQKSAAATAYLGLAQQPRRCAAAQRPCYRRAATAWQVEALGGVHQYGKRHRVAGCGLSEKREMTLSHESQPATRDPRLSRTSFEGRSSLLRLQVWHAALVDAAQRLPGSRYLTNVRHKSTAARDAHGLLIASPAHCPRHCTTHHSP